MDRQAGEKRLLTERPNSAASGIDNEEMMVIEINFGKNKKDDIVVHFGDDPAALAESFVKKHKLKERAVPTIANHIIDTVEAHLQAAENADRTHSPFDPVVRPFSPKTQSLRNIFRADGAGTQSFGDSSDVSFGMSPIGRGAARDSFNEINPPATSESPTNRQSGYFSPLRQASVGRIKSPGHDVSSRQPSFDDTAPAQRLRKSFDLDEDGVSPGALRHLGSHSPEKASSGDGKAQVPGAVDPSDEGQNSSKIISEDTLSLHTENDEDARQYNSMKSSWKAGTSKKTQEQISQKLSQQKRTDGLIVATASRSKKKTPRTAIFSGHITDTSFKRITANERLYQGASVRVQRQEMKRNESILQEVRKLAEGRNSIKLKGRSKEIVMTLSQRDAGVDITQRLYAEAASIRDMKDQVEKREQLKQKKEMWSCPLCCTYHEPEKAQIYAADETKHCSACGWAGIIEEMPFKPTAVNLQYALTGVDRSEMIRNSHARRGVENFPDGASRGQDIFDYLYKDNLHQREKVLLMQNKWSEEHEKLTFKPEIPTGSIHILNKRVVSGDDVSMASHRSSQNTHGRLYCATIACQEENVSVDRKDSSKLVDPAEHDKFIDRLTYEYEAKAKRQEELRKLFLETDVRTGKPLFKPTIPGSTMTHVMHLPENDDREASTEPDSKEKIYEKLLRRGEEHKERMQKLREHFIEREEMDMKAHSKHSLEESARILHESSVKSIGEIFKVLLTCQMHNEAKMVPNGTEISKKAQGLDPEVLLQISLELSNWREGVLNIVDADPELMIESVQSLLTDVIELSKTKNSNAKYPDIYIKYDKPILLDLEQFSEHVWTCIRKREGGGKSYLFLPKRAVSPKKVEVTPPFKPVIDPKSREMVESRRDPSVPIEESLLTKYEQSQLRFEDIKRDVEQQKYADCTFQPHMFKPAKGVKPRQKYQRVHEALAARCPPPPPPQSPSIGIGENTQQSKKKGVVVSASRVPSPSVKQTYEAPAQLYDFENESLDNSNDSMTVPRQSIMSAFSLDSPPEQPKKLGPTFKINRQSDSSGGVSIYSPPWIKK